MHTSTPHFQRRRKGLPSGTGTGRQLLFLRRHVLVQRPETLLAVGIMIGVLAASGLTHVSGKQMRLRQ